MSTLAARQTRFKLQQCSFAAKATRRETPRERTHRLRPGWDWRNGGRAERDKARDTMARRV